MIPAALTPYALFGIAFGFVFGLYVLAQVIEWLTGKKIL